MEQQLTFAFSSDSEAQNLYRHLLSVLDAERESGIRTDCRGATVSISLLPRRGEGPERLAERSAAWIAEYMIENVEDRLLRDMAARSVKAAPEEIERMVGYCKQILNDTDSGGEPAGGGRKDIVRKALLGCFAERPYLNVDGFLRFRLRDYLDDLRDIADYAANEFVLDRQYQEFIELLRYFIHFQESRIHEVHLIHEGGTRYMLFDSEMRPIDGFAAEEVVLETLDCELNVEDMVVSALISASPGRIHLHTREHHAASVKTIGQIFESRVRLCHGCKVCAPLLGERKGEGGIPLDR